jgi:hypothetical protein
MSEGLVLFVGLCIVAWQLDRIHRLLKAIHFMMRHEYGERHGLGPDR